MIKGTLAWRITFVLTCLISLAVCLAASLSYFVYTHLEDNMINKLIQTEAKRLVSRVSSLDSEWPRPFELDMAPSMYAWGESGQHWSDDLPPELRELPAGLHTITLNSQVWHVAIENATDGRVYVAYNPDVLQHQYEDFSRALLAIVIGCSLLGLLISAFAAKWLITPLNELTERLIRWIPNSANIEELPRNEADRLMMVFNRAQDQIDASIAHQREFTANLHHEIRTPLTVIRSDAELMLKANSMAPEHRRIRLERIVRAVTEINQSLESTYSLAHANFSDRSLVRIADCVDDIFENCRLEAERAGLVLINEVAPEYEHCLSRQALMTVMRNIVRNAITHAAPARFTVQSVPNGLHFTDSGPGIPASELPYIFERYYSNRRADEHSDGSVTQPSRLPHLNQTGLGLAIAKRVCTTKGWQLNVVSPVNDHGGTRFELLFQEDKGQVS